MKITQDIYYRSIEELKGKSTPEAARAVAREMEAIFAYELIKAMRGTSDKGFLGDGIGNDIYMSIFDLEIARVIAERGQLGLQEMLLKGLDKLQKTEEPNREALLPPEPKFKTHNPNPFHLPVDGAISSNFGMRRHPIYGDNRFHEGLDIAAPEGTDIYPIKEGRVIFSGQQGSYGNIVIIDHGDEFISKYAHNSVNLVKEGDEVDSNTIIAKVGSTGVSTAPHLHFEVRYHGESTDPLDSSRWLVKEFYRFTDNNIE